MLFRNRSKRNVFILAGAFTTLALGVGAYMLYPRSAIISRRSVSEAEINSYLKTEAGGTDSKLTAAKVHEFLKAKKAQSSEEASKVRSERLKAEIAKAKYNNAFTQALIDPAGGVLENDFVKVTFPEKTVSSPTLVTYKLKQGSAKKYQLGSVFELTAEDMTGKELHTFAKNIQLTTKNVGRGASTYYLNEVAGKWEKVYSIATSNSVIAITNHFSNYATGTEAPADPAITDYDYADCTMLVDDSYEFDENTSDDIDRTNCFSSKGNWNVQQVGVYNTSKYTSDFVANADWIPDYKNLKGEVELFLVLPEVPSLRESQDPITGETIPAKEYAKEVTYYIKTIDAGLQEVVVNLANAVPGQLSLGKFNFDGTGASVNLYGMSFADYQAKRYMVADAVCFGACPEEVVKDLTPPEIKNVQSLARGDDFVIAADVTDADSGVSKVYVWLNKTLYDMNSIGGDRYEAMLPGSLQGQKLDYYIIAYDNAGNEAIWNPTLGYVTRGTGLDIGIPPEARRFVNYKKNYYNKVMPAKAGVSPCNQCAGDPVNLQNGNLLEQMELAKIAGRPEINFNIQYNSLGGAAGIFGESWTHSYNYKIQEFSSKVFLTYPGGNIQEFRKDGDKFVPENPFLTDTLRKSGDSFTLTSKEQTVTQFDVFGDVESITDRAGNVLTFKYAKQNKFTNISRLSEIKAESGRKLSFEYSAKGLVTKLILPDQRAISLNYSNTNDLTSVINENGNETKFDYENHVIVKKYSPEGHTYYTNKIDDQRRITQQIAGDDFVQTYEYLDGKTLVRDSNGTVGEYAFAGNLMLTNTDEVGSKTKFEYDLNKRIIAETDPEGNRTEYSYDDRGNQTLVKHADGTVTKREFNDKNQITRLEDKDPQHVTTFAYDAQGNMTEIKNALGEVTSYRYNSENEVIEIKDAKGFSQNFVYNSQGDLVSVTDKEGAVTRYEYNEQGRRIAEIDALGRRTSFEYDAIGNLIKVQKPLGVIETYEYDKNNRLIKSVNANGGVTLFNYDLNENLVETTDALGNKKSFTYGEMNEILKETNEEGIVTNYAYTPDYQLKKIIAAAGTSAESTTSYTYNQYNAPVKVTDAEGRVTSFTYDKERRLTVEALDATGRNAQTKYTYNARGVVTSQADPEGRVTRFELDALDRVVKAIDAEGGETRYTYDNLGNKTSQTDPKGNVTKFEYDREGRIVKVTDAKGQVSSYKYDLVGNLLETTNPKGVVTTYEYDALNRLVKEVKNPQNFVTAAFSNSNEVNITTSYEYDKLGNVIKQTNARGFATQFAYDAMNRVVEVKDAKGNSTKFVYNKLGSLLSVTDRNGNVTKSKYDALQRVVEQINAKGHSTNSTYDKVGNTITQTDARGNTTKFVYNGLNQLISQIDALGGITRYDYDRVGNTLKATDANNHATTYTYDKLNRLIAEINPEGHKIVTAYDANSNSIKRMDARGNATSYEYDELNRLVKEVNALGGNKSYVYDQLGNLVAETDANGHTDKYAYDALDRQVSEADAEGNISKSEYDKNGNLLKLIDANGNPTAYEFDELDRLVKQINAAGEQNLYTYDNETNITVETANDGVKTTYNYDPIYQLERVSLNAGGEAKSSTANVDTSYTYDPTGNLTRIVDPKGNATNFAYDALNRQVRETNALSNSWSFGYDAVGNRTSRVDANGQATAYAYYPDNMLKTISYVGKYNVSYAYDANNNEVSITDNLGTTLKTYDALNSETSVKDALNRTLNYAYDNEQNVTKITYPGGKVVSYGYLKNDWMSEMKDPSGMVTSYNYDRVGNNTEIRNPNNTLSTYKYDKVNRVTAINNINLNGNTNSSFFYSYDNVGQRTKVEKAYGWQQPSSVTETYSYDPIRRLTSSVSTTSKGSVINNYNYDRNSNRVSWSSNDNANTPRPFDKAELVYQYDAINELLKVTEKGYNPGQKEVLGTSTSSSSSSTSSASSSKTTYKTITKTKPVIVNQFIDGLKNFETELEVQKGKQITDKAYTDLMDQLKVILKKAEAGILTRSEAEKLIEKLTKSIEAYADSKDIKTPGIENSLLTKLKNVDINLLPVALPTTTEKVPATSPGNSGNTPSVNAPGQIKGRTTRDPKTVKEVLFTYDRNGNRISKLIDGPQGPEDQLTLYSYDPENRLTQVLNQQRGNTENSWMNRDVTAMKYDALGRRLVKTYAPKAITDSEGNVLDTKKKTEYLYNYRDPIAEYDILKSQRIDMYRGISNRIASVENGYSKDFLHYDALNSVVGITNKDGGNGKNIRYHDFGKIDDNNTQRSDSTGGTNMDPHNHYAYTGQEWDEHMEVYEFYSRAYDPEFGVWLRQDDYRGTPRDPQSLHRFNYVKQSPVNYWDSYGYQIAAIGADLVGMAELFKTLGVQTITIEVVVHGVSLLGLTTTGGMLLTASAVGSLGAVGNSAIHGYTPSMVRENKIAMIEYIGSQVGDFKVNYGSWSFQYFSSGAYANGRCFLNSREALETLEYSKLNAVYSGAWMAQNAESKAPTGTSDTGNADVTNGINNPLARLVNKFRNLARLADHFGRHGGKFGAKTMEEYERMASNFLNKRADGINIFGFLRANGEKVLYDRSTNEFAVLSSDGFIKTYFKPTRGFNYYLSQT